MPRRNPAVIGKAMPNEVLTHTCYSIERGDLKPKVCACRKRVSRLKAKLMVIDGLAEYVLMYDKQNIYHSPNEICIIERKKSTPRAATIERAHIERAYLDGDLQEQERIKVYGEMQREFFTSLTNLYDNDEWAAAEKKYRGRYLSIVDGGDLIRPIEEKK